MRDAIAAAHRAVAAVAGEVATALAMNKVRQSQLRDWVARLRAAAEGLQEVTEEIDSGKLD